MYYSFFLRKSLTLIIFYRPLDPSLPRPPKVTVRLDVYVTGRVVMQETFYVIISKNSLKLSVKVILYSYLILKKMNERITDS